MVKEIYKYKKIECVGEGAYGIVYKIKDENGNIYALKRNLLDKTTKHKGLMNLREIDIYKRMKHPYITNKIKIIKNKEIKMTPKTKYKNDKYYIITDLARFSLDEFIYKKIKPISHIKRSFYQILCGLKYLHDNNIIHRDIKPGNILCYYKDGILTTKLTDFGMSRVTYSIDKNSNNIVTTNYKPPEILLNNKYYNNKIDIWSVGCTFYEVLLEQDIVKNVNTKDDMLVDIFKFIGIEDINVLEKISNNKNDIHEFLKTYKYDFKNINDNRSYLKEQLFKKILTKYPEFNNDIVDNIRNPGNLFDFCDLLINMLQIDPDKRFDCNQCLNHNFFKDINPDDKLQYNIYHHNNIIVNNNHILDKPLFDKNGLSIFNFFINISYQFFVEYTDFRFFRSFFLGLDLYHRFTFFNKNLLNRTNHNIIAISCLYIGHKYYFDYLCPDIDILFECFLDKNFILPDDYILNFDFDFDSIKYSLNTYSQSSFFHKLEKIEHIILYDILDFHIYRTTIFDLLFKNTDSLTKYNLSHIYILYKNLIDNFDIYDNTIFDIYESIISHFSE